MSSYNSNKYSLRKGQKVITTPLTYVATVNAIILAGLEPVFVDVDRYTFGITAERIDEHLEQVEDMREYGLILPVHLMGYPCDMDGINRVAAKYNIPVFEDSAQAHGSLYKGGKTGSLSLEGAFSFYIAHNIQAGEMGALVTDSPEIDKLCRKLRAHGRFCSCILCTRSKGKCPYRNHWEEDYDPRFMHEYVGYNFKVMEFQAALAITQLKKADWIFERRKRNVVYLNNGLGNYSNILHLPAFSEDVSYLAYPIVIKDPMAISRKYLRAKLEERGIETRPLFGCIPIHQPAFESLKLLYQGRLPNAEYLGSQGFYIGCHQYLGQEDLDYIINVFQDILEKVGRDAILEQ